MKNKLLLFLILIIAGLGPHLTFANGGDQRIVENKYVINLSRAPFTPRVGVTTSFLASFVDIQKNKLIAEDLIVHVRIAKLGGVGTNKRNFLFEKDTILVQGGVLELPYTFAEDGLHEIFFDFAFASNPQKVYAAPDFLLDVQKPINRYDIHQILVLTFVSFVMGLIAGWCIKKVVSRKRRE